MPQSSDISSQVQYGVGPIPYHTHNEIDSAKIDYTALVNIPSSATTLGFFGTGIDGDVTLNANTTLTRDMFYGKLVVNSGYVLYPNGYKIFASKSVDVV